MASLKSISITVGEQITVEQLTELSIVMRISRCRIESMSRGGVIRLLDQIKI